MSVASHFRSSTVRVFEPTRGRYASFRIPAIVKVGDSILAFCEGRRNSAADSGEIDIVSRRSEDGGASWGPLRIVSSGVDTTIGNPAPVVPLGNTTVLLLSVRNSASVTESDIVQGLVAPAESRRVFVQRSSDSGRTFGPPRDITASTKLDSWGWYAIGPGHGIALTSGRLLVPGNHSVLGVPTPCSYGAHCLYSDDNGQTWSIGFVDHNDGSLANANESAAAELPDGRIYLNARNQNGTAAGTRLQAYSTDGGHSIEQPYTPQPQIHTPVVQGNLLQWSGGPRPPLLYSGPGDPAARRQMGVQLSTDGGQSWHLGCTFDDAPAAYSDLVQLDSEAFGVLYETGVNGPYEEISFQRIEVRELTYHQERAC